MLRDARLLEIIYFNPEQPRPRMKSYPVEVTSIMKFVSKPRAATTRLPEDGNDGIATVNSVFDIPVETPPGRLRGELNDAVRNPEEATEQTHLRQIALVEAT
jgi:hypothetical protein